MCICYNVYAYDLVGVIVCVEGYFTIWVKH